MMTYTPTDFEIAHSLCKNLAGERDTLLRWFGEKFPQDSGRLEGAKTAENLAAELFVELFDRTRNDRPELTESEVLTILRAWNGILLPRTSHISLPHVLANEVSEGMLQEPEAEPLRREIEDGIDSVEVLELMEETRPWRMRARLLEMSQESAFAMLVSIKFWWAQQCLFHDLGYDPAPEDYRLVHFFRIVPDRATTGSIG